MRAIVRALAAFFFSLGGPGLLLLGALDSSFLFMPFGNDLMLVALTTAHRERILYYAAMATAGSVVGVALTYWVSARGGEKGIERLEKSGRIGYVMRKVRERGGVAIAAAALIPPPFPFTPFIIVAGVLQYPRNRMLAIVAGCRAVRFAVDGSLALIYGRRLIRLAQSPAVVYFILALFVISMVGSGISIARWVRQSRART
jgi:membrane protein YqaA with SNARE-associated domain